MNLRERRSSSLLLFFTQMLVVQLLLGGFVLKHPHSHHLGGTEAAVGPFKSNTSSTSMTPSASQTLLSSSSASLVHSQTISNVLSSSVSSVLTLSTSKASTATTSQILSPTASTVLSISKSVALSASASLVATPSATNSFSSSIPKTASDSIPISDSSSQTLSHSRSATLSFSESHVISASASEVLSPTVSLSLSSTLSKSQTNSLTGASESHSASVLITASTTATFSWSRSFSSTGSFSLSISGPSHSLTPSLSESLTSTITPPPTPTSTTSFSVTPTISETPSRGSTSETQSSSSTNSFSGTQTKSASTTASMSSSFSKSLSLSHSESVTLTEPSLSWTASIPPTPTESLTFSKSLSLSSTLMLTASLTHSVTRSISATVTPPPTPTITSSLTKSMTPTITPPPTPTLSLTVSITPPPTPSISETITPPPTPTKTLTETWTRTLEQTMTKTIALSETKTNSQTTSSSLSQSFTISEVPTVTATGTDTHSLSSTETLSHTLSPLSPSVSSTFSLNATCYNVSVAISPTEITDEYLRTNNLHVVLTVWGTSFNHRAAFLYPTVALHLLQNPTEPSIPFVVGSLPLNHIEPTFSGVSTIHFIVFKKQNLKFGVDHFLRFQFPLSTFKCEKPIIESQAVTGGILEKDSENANMFLRIKAASKPLAISAAAMGLAATSSIALGTSSVAGFVGGAAASDLQVVLLLSQIQCSSTADRESLNRFGMRLIVPAFLDATPVQFVLANIFLSLVIVLCHGIVLLVVQDAQRRKRRDNGTTDDPLPYPKLLLAAAAAMFPSFSISMAQLLYLGVAFGSFRIFFSAGEKNGAVAGDYLVAVIGVLWLLALPIGTFLWLMHCRRNIFSADFHFEKYEYPSTLSRWKRIFLPSGTWRPEELVHMFGAFIANLEPNYKGEEKHTDLDTIDDPFDAAFLRKGNYKFLAFLFYPFILFFFTGLLIAMNPFDGTTCWKQYLLIGCVYLACAVIVGVFSPYRTTFWNFSSVLMLILVAMVCFAGSNSSLAARDALVALISVVTGAVILRIIYAIFLFIYEEKVLLKPLEQAKLEKQRNWRRGEGDPLDRVFFERGGTRPVLTVVATVPTVEQAFSVMEPGGGEEEELRQVVNALSQMPKASSSRHQETYDTEGAGGIQPYPEDGAFWDEIDHIFKTAVSKQQGGADYLPPRPLQDQSLDNRRSALMNALGENGEDVINDPFAKKKHQDAMSLTHMEDPRFPEANFSEAFGHVKDAFSIVDVKNPPKVEEEEFLDDIFSLDVVEKKHSGGEGALMKPLIPDDDDL